MDTIGINNKKLSNITTWRPFESFIHLCRKKTRENRKQGSSYRYSAEIEDQMKAFTSLASKMSTTGSACAASTTVRSVNKARDFRCAKYTRERSKLLSVYKPLVPLH